MEQLWNIWNISKKYIKIIFYFIFDKVDLENWKIDNIYVLLYVLSKSEWFLTK